MANELLCSLGRMAASASGGDNFNLENLRAYLANSCPHLHVRRTSAVDFFAAGSGCAARILRVASRFRLVTDWLMRRFVNDRYLIPVYGGGVPGGPAK